VIILNKTVSCYWNAYIYLFPFFFLSFHNHNKIQLTCILSPSFPFSMVTFHSLLQDVHTQSFISTLTDPGFFNSGALYKKICSINICHLRLFIL